MRRLGFILTLLSLPLAAQTPYGRLNFQLQNAQGQAISGATVYVYAQSACGVAADLSNPAAIYSTATGTVLPQPVITDGFGTGAAYVPRGCYTVVYYSPYTGTVTLTDQNAFAASAAGNAGGTNTQIQYNSGGSLAGSLATLDAPGNFNTSGTVTAPSFLGTLTGNVTGNLTGTVTGHSSLDLPLAGGAISGLLKGQALAAPAAPVCAIGGSGALLNAAYEWEVAFMTANGLTDFSTPCNYLTLANQAAHLTLPIDPTGQALYWVVRRTSAWTDPATGHNLFFMDVPFAYDPPAIAYNAGATGWDDPNLDSALIYDVPFNVEIPRYNTTAQTSQFLPAVPSNTPVYTFSPVDNRPLKDGPDINLAYPQTPVTLVGAYNLSTCTEAITPNTCGWSSAGNMGFDATSTRTVTGVAPSPIVLNHFVATAAGTAGGGPVQAISGHITLSTNQAYLLSYFVKGNNQQEQVNSHGWNTGATNSWDYAWIDNLVRRKWFYCVATSSVLLDCGQNTNVAFGSGTGIGQVQWDLAEFANFNNYMPPNLSTFSSDRYIGGFQVEPVATTAYGIVAMGDSLTQIDCKGYASYDTAGCSSWTNIAAGMLNVPIFNKGHGGVTLDTILTDYLGTTGGFAGVSGQAVVQAGRAKYVIIEGGGNDLDAARHRSPATVEGEFTSFINQVRADGASPVCMTISPRTGQGQYVPDFESSRQAINSWLRAGASIGSPSVSTVSTTNSNTTINVTSGTGILPGYSITGSGIPAGAVVTAIVGTTVTSSLAATASASVTLTFAALGCPSVIDLDTIIRDPVVPSEILNNPNWTSPLEGTHWQFNARRAVGEYIAASYVGNTTGHPQIFNFPTPLAYQSVPVSTPTQSFTAGHAVISAANNQLADGGVLPSAPGLADNVTPGLMKGDGASISCTAGTCTATTGGGGTVVVDTPGTFSAADIVPRSTAAGIKIGPSSIRDNGTKVTGASGMTADGLMGVPVISGHYAAINQTANITAGAGTSLLTVPASPAVTRFVVCMETIVTTAGTGGGTPGLPSGRVSYTDATTGVTINRIVSASLTGNTVGTTSSAGCVPISAQAASLVEVNTSGYASGTAPVMQFAIYAWIKAEQ